MSNLSDFVHEIEEFSKINVDYRAVRIPCEVAPCYDFENTNARELLLFQRIRGSFI